MLGVEDAESALKPQKRARLTSFDVKFGESNGGSEHGLIDEAADD